MQMNILIRFNWTSFICYYYSFIYWTFQCAYVWGAIAWCLLLDTDCRCPFHLCETLCPWWMFIVVVDVDDADAHARWTSIVIKWVWITPSDWIGLCIESLHLVMEAKTNQVDNKIPNIITQGAGTIFRPLFLCHSKESTVSISLNGY